MERIHGVTLRSELQRSHALSPALTADWFEQLLDGIAAAHAQGIVHRDLTPENVIGLRKDPHSLVVKILDFGLAKLGPEASLVTGTLTTDGAVMGTLGYMSPEQLLGQDVDHRTDIFAVGVMIAEALTGRRPFEGDGYGEFVQAALHGDIIFRCRRVKPRSSILCSSSASPRIARTVSRRPQNSADRSFPLFALRVTRPSSVLANTGSWRPVVREQGL